MKGKEMLELTKELAIGYTTAMAKDCRDMADTISQGADDPDWLGDKHTWSTMADNMDEVANYIEMFKANAEWSAFAAMKKIVQDVGFENLTEESKKLIKVALEDANVKMAELTKI